VLIDGPRLSSVEAGVWSHGQAQKDLVRPVSGIHPSLKPASAAAAGVKRKVSEDDDDDASDSEKMVICEDESAGTDYDCD